MTNICDVAEEGTGISADVTNVPVAQPVVMQPLDFDDVVSNTLCVCTPCIYDRRVKPPLTFGFHLRGRQVGSHIAVI